MNQSAHILFEPVVGPLWLVPLKRGRAACITGGRHYGHIYRPTRDGAWLPDGELTEAQMKRLKERMSEAKDWGAPIFHCPGNRELDKPIAALSRALYERSTPVSGFRSPMLAPLLDWLVEGLAKNKAPADVYATFQRSILGLSNGPDSAHEVIIAMESILELMEKIKAVLDEGPLKPKLTLKNQRRQTA